MKAHDFIFGKKFPGRYYRHIAFWLSWWIFLLVHKLIFINNMGIPRSFYATLFSIKFFIFFGEITYVYFIVYWVLPKLKSSSTLILFLVAVALAIVVHSITSLTIFYVMDELDEPADIMVLKFLNEVRNFLRTGPLIVCCLFASCKMAKNYYLKLEEKNALVKENAHAEMQLLKAQVHPHFLFNTLNNIYSFIVKKSPAAEGLISKLSDTIHYMVNECEASLVPLEKEIKMIIDYTGLEQVRYGDRLKMEIRIEGDPADKLIAPLLLIPFVENSFKHGSSQMLQQPWINIHILVEQDHLVFKIENSKPGASRSAPEKEGIGLKNVKKRMGLLYLSGYEVMIDNKEDSFSVFIRIPIQNMPVVTSTFNESDELSSSTTKLSYA